MQAECAADMSPVPPRSAASLPRIAGDGRRRETKVLRRLVETFVTALGGNVDPATLLRLHRLAEQMTLAEAMRRTTIEKTVAGRARRVDVGGLVRLENLINRGLRELGLDRQRPMPKPTLAQRLAATSAGAGSET